MKEDKSRKIKRQIALTCACVSMGSFFIGALLMMFLCMTAVTGMSDLVDVYSIIFLAAFFFLGIMVYFISRAAVDSPEAFKWWVNNQIE